MRGAFGRKVTAAGLVLAVAVSSVPAGMAMAQTLGEQNAAQRETQLVQTQEPQATQAGGEEKAAASAKEQQKKKAAAKKLTAGEKAVKAAKKYLGTPYVYGGSTPSGFDCSGFTMYVYNKLGIKLSHNAQAQYSQGKHVAKSQLKAGDLVFFGSSAGSITHVGMYVGNGKFIHSPQTGEVVRIQKLSSRTNFVGAARVA